MASLQPDISPVCPPASISVALANGATSGTITQGVQQNLTTSVIDTKGNSLTGLTLDYQSTDPVDSDRRQHRRYRGNLPRHRIHLCHLPAAYLQSSAH